MLISFLFFFVLFFFCFFFLFFFQFRNEEKFARGHVWLKGKCDNTLTFLDLWICGLEHCHVTNGHAGDRCLDVLFEFLFAIFSLLHFYTSYQTHPTFWNSNLYEWHRISEENGV